MSAQTAPSAAALDRAQVVADLRAYLAGISDGKLTAADIDPAGHLFDCGYVDSLSAVMFTAHLEEHYGIRIDEVELLEQLSNLDAVAGHLCGAGR
jgi:acyl carrier protein